MEGKMCNKNGVEKFKTNPEQPSKVIAITFDVAFKKPSFHSISASFSISLALQFDILKSKYIAFITSDYDWNYFIKFIR